MARRIPLPKNTLRLRTPIHFTLFLSLPPGSPGAPVIATYLFIYKRLMTNRRHGALIPGRTPSPAATVGARGRAGRRLPVRRGRRTPPPRRRAPPAARRPAHLVPDAGMPRRRRPRSRAATRSGPRRPAAGGRAPRRRRRRAAAPPPRRSEERR